MKDRAVKYFLTGGYSCSEAVIKAAAEEGLIDENPDVLMKIASAFSGGMASGCVCGAVSASQICIGAKYGRTDASGEKIGNLSSELVSKFKEKHRATCCKFLSRGFEHSDPNRKLHCQKFVADACDILEGIIKNKS